MSAETYIKFLSKEPKFRDMSTKEDIEYYQKNVRKNYLGCFKSKEKAIEKARSFFSNFDDLIRSENHSTFIFKEFKKVYNNCGDYNYLLDHVCFIKELNGDFHLLRHPTAT